MSVEANALPPLQMWNTLLAKHTSDLDLLTACLEIEYSGIGNTDHHEMLQACKR